MNKIMTGRALGSAILKVLGIESKWVTGVSVDCGEPGVAMVTIMRLVTKPEGEELLRVLDQYALERKPEELEGQAMETVARNLLKG